MDAAEANDEQLERRLAELQFVESAYSPEEAWYENHGGSLPPTIHRLLSLSSDETIKAQLTLTMTPNYPISSPLEISATIVAESKTSQSQTPTQMKKDAWDALPNLLQVCRHEADSSIGEETIWKVFSRAEAWIQVEWPSLCSTDKHVSEFPLSEPMESSNSLGNAFKKNTDKTLGRRLIYSHHIIATSKRTAIRELTSHYQLTGYVKIGWPGIILIEGREQDCLDFYDDIRPMSWQYLVVRGEQQEAVKNDDDLKSKRKFSSFQEVDDMSILARNCREVGLESLFRTSMKNYKEKEDDSVTENLNEDKHESVYGVLVQVDYMNSGKSYRKWLRKTSHEVGCSILVKQCFPNEDFTRRPLIVVAIVGYRGDVGNMLKRWRTSRVDVDSKGQACLERKMSILIEGSIVEESLNRNDWEELQAEERINAGYKQLTDIVHNIGGEEWRSAFEDAAKGLIE